MSGTAVAEARPEAGAAPDAARTEASASAQGWRPKEQWQGDPDKWVDAAEFLRRGFESPAILADRTRRMEGQLNGVRSELADTRTKLGEALETINLTTEMMRTADKRAYDRALREIQEKRQAAVASGDEGAFQRADAEMEELRKTEPKAATARQPNGAAQPTPGAAAPVAEPLEVASWKRDNQWYNQDAEMQSFADGVHISLLRSSPGMTMGENLASVRRQVERAYPDRFDRAGPSAREPDGDGGSRRGDAPAVVPSGEPSGSGSRTPRRNFDSMPKESKDAYGRYAKQLEGKGKPLTKDEWSESYWSQFQEVP